ncbi:MAG: hypothetical protein WCG04_01605 [Alphaproteobacteria bacterium]
MPRFARNDVRGVIASPHRHCEAALAAAAIQALPLAATYMDN